MIHIHGFTLQALNYILAFWFSKTYIFRYLSFTRNTLPTYPYTSLGHSYFLTLLTKWQ